MKISLAATEMHEFKSVLSMICNDRHFIYLCMNPQKLARAKYEMRNSKHVAGVDETVFSSSSCSSKTIHNREISFTSTYY